VGGERVVGKEEVGGRREGFEAWRGGFSSPGALASERSVLVTAVWFAGAVLSLRAWVCAWLVYVICFRGGGISLGESQGVN
jgi:hypothetical protein